MSKLTDAEKSQLCLGCLACCRQLRFPLPHGHADDPDTVKFYRARGVRIVEAMEGGRRRVYASIDVACPKLTELGCSIYPVRPRACREFDGSLDFETKSFCKWKEGER